MFLKFSTGVHNKVNSCEMNEKIKLQNYLLETLVVYTNNHAQQNQTIRT